MDGQLSLFDNVRPVVIDSLENELDQIFGKDNKQEREDSYSVWEHVPYLGKRLCLWYEIIKDDWNQEKIDELIARYKTQCLEISFCFAPDLSNKNKERIMCSTMWLTKGHKEKG